MSFLGFFKRSSTQTISKGDGDATGSKPEVNPSESLLDLRMSLLEDQAGHVNEVEKKVSRITRLWHKAINSVGLLAGGASKRAGEASKIAKRAALKAHEASQKAGRTATKAKEVSRKIEKLERDTKQIEALVREAISRASDAQKEILEIRSLVSNFTPKRLFHDSEVTPHTAINSSLIFAIGSPLKESLESSPHSPRMRSQRVISPTEHIQLEPASGPLSDSVESEAKLLGPEVVYLRERIGAIDISEPQINMIVARVREKMQQDMDDRVRGLEVRFNEHSHLSRNGPHFSKESKLEVQENRFNIIERDLECIRKDVFELRVALNQETALEEVFPVKATTEAENAENSRKIEDSVGFEKDPQQGKDVLLAEDKLEAKEGKGENKNSTKQNLFSDSTSNDNRSARNTVPVSLKNAENTSFVSPSRLLLPGLSSYAALTQIPPIENLSNGGPRRSDESTKFRDSSIREGFSTPENSMAGKRETPMNQPSSEEVDSFQQKTCLKLPESQHHHLEPNMGEPSDSNIYGRISRIENILYDIQTQLSSQSVLSNPNFALMARYQNSIQRKLFTRESELKLEQKNNVFEDRLCENSKCIVDAITEEYSEVYEKRLEVKDRQINDLRSQVERLTGIIEKLAAEDEKLNSRKHAEDRLITRSSRETFLEHREDFMLSAVGPRNEAPTRKSGSKKIFALRNAVYEAKYIQRISQKVVRRGSGGFDEVSGRSRDSSFKLLVFKLLRQGSERNRRN